MTYPERFSNLPESTWPRLRALLDPLAAGDAGGGSVVNMTIGEPKHAFPDWVPAALAEYFAEFNSYPDNHGIPALRSAISDWVQRRYGVTVDPDTQIMALNGTREGLYNAQMALSPEGHPYVLTPNPFYPVYSVGALSTDAVPHYMAADASTGFLPDFDAVPADVLNKTSVAFICSPANPQGSVASMDYLQNLIRLADKYDFKVFADECYSEIYRHTAPTGALEAAHAIGADPERVVVFHSLSKRSNLPGLRSGFVVSGPENMKRIKALRAYAGAPLPGPVQQVSAKVWADEKHVEENRALYTEKFDIADEIFAGVDGYFSPPAGFFLWLPVKDGQQTAIDLWTKDGVRVLPGAYLSHTVHGENPGQNYIRVALVAPKEETRRGLTLIRDRLYG